MQAIYEGEASGQKADAPSNSSKEGGIPSRQPFNNRGNKTDVIVAPTWPAPLVEDFSDPDWPDLSSHHTQHSNPQNVNGATGSNGSGESTLERRNSSQMNPVELWVLRNKKLLVRLVTWNLCAKSPPPVSKIIQQLLPRNKFHVYIVGSEECERSIAKSALNPSKRVWENYLLEAVGSNYVALRSHTLQAIHIMIFVHKSISHLCSIVTSAAVPTGMGSTLGNKGGVGVYLKIARTRILVVNAHLAAHQRAEKRRNAEFQRINLLMPLLLEKKDAVLVPRTEEGIAKSQFSNVEDAGQMQQPSLTLERPADYKQVTNSAEDATDGTARGGEGEVEVGSKRDDAGLPLSPGAEGSRSATAAAAGGIAFSPAVPSSNLGSRVPDASVEHEENKKRLPPTSPPISPANNDAIETAVVAGANYASTSNADASSSDNSKLQDTSFPSSNENTMVSSRNIQTTEPQSALSTAAQEGLNIDSAAAIAGNSSKSPLSPTSNGADQSSVDARGNDNNLHAVPKQLSGLGLRGAEEDWQANSDYETDNDRAVSDSPRSNYSHQSHHSHIDPLADLDASVKSSKRTLNQCAELVVFMGDLNYRINGNRAIISKLLDNRMHEVLLNNDQLRANMRQQLVLKHFAEAPLNFKPTYKYDVGTQMYDSSPKNRIPSWTDRILYVPSSKVRCLAYNADDALTTSDHRPVYASFALTLEDFIQLDDDNNLVAGKIAPEFTSESQVCSIM